MKRMAPTPRTIIYPLVPDPEVWDQQDGAEKRPVFYPVSLMAEGDDKSAFLLNAQPRTSCHRISLIFLDSGLCQNDATRAFQHLKGAGIPPSSCEMLGDKGSSPSPSGRGARAEGLSTAPSAQRGAALIIGLLFLLVVILVSISGIQTVALEEKMAGAAYDRNLAFQAAESALRAGEAVALAQSNLDNAGFPPAYNDANDNCPGNSAIIDNCNNNGLCPTPDKDCAPRWKVAGFNKWADATGLNLGSLAGAAPQYFIEFLGGPFACVKGGQIDSACYRYRITARSNPATDRSTVILQSVYIW